MKFAMQVEQGAIRDGPSGPPATAGSDNPETRVSHERLLAAIEAMPDGFCLYDATDRLVHCNQRYREVYPRHADQLLIGERFADMLRAGVERGEFPDAIGREEAFITERLSRHREPMGPIEQRLADGRWLRIEEKRTGAGEIVGLRTDITALKVAERQAQERAEILSDYLDIASDWYWETDAEHRFTYMSKNVERLVGVPEGWHYGKSRAELFDAATDPETAREHLETLAQRRPFRNFEYRRVGQGVEPKWLRTSGKPIFDESGNFVGYRGCATDITAQKLAEEGLRHSQATLLQAQKSQAIGQLTGGVAHDFNNLLAVIQGNLELIRECFDVPEAKEMIDAALQATARGAKLTAQLLQFGRRAPLAPEVLDLNGVTRRLHGMLVQLIPGNIAISLTVAGDLPGVELDRAELEAALMNIVLNARDALAEGGEIAIAIEGRSVGGADGAPGPAGLAPGRYAVVTVRDTGRGMEPDVLARATEPFFTTKEVGKGTGLGLSQALGFAKQSRGELEIASRPGHGTTVTLWFPAREADLVATAVAVPEHGTAPGRTPVVLVVEDRPDVLAVISAQLRALGHRVIEARDGVAALAHLEGGDPIDLVLADLVVPGPLQGLAVREHARRLRPGIKVLLMSGNPNDAFDHADADGPAAVLLKPIARAELAERVAAALAG